MSEQSERETIRSLIEDARRWPREDEGDLVNDLADALTEAERALTESYAKRKELLNLNIRAEEVIRGQLPAVKELEKQLTEANTRIAVALALLGPAGWVLTYSVVDKVRAALSTTKED